MMCNSSFCRTQGLSPRFNRIEQSLYATKGCARIQCLSSPNRVHIHNAGCCEGSDKTGTSSGIWHFVAGRAYIRRPSHSGSGRSNTTTFFVIIRWRLCWSGSGIIADDRRTGAAL